ncbi:hypothetical protein ACIQVL_10730 [Streptomyces sp. NPDC090499]|uniref:hypothetical protein n=1 Tax=Streptomyces sp. NPDC090499 TaxID=3365965 RepID=UPI0038289CE7
MIDDYRLCLSHRWREGCTNTTALTREIQQLGYCGDINPVRRHLRPCRTVTIPTDAPLPRLTVRRVTDGTTRRPEHLTETEHKFLDELCERSPALALDVWLADVRLDGQRELRTLAAGIRRDRAAVLADLTTTFTSGALDACSVDTLRHRARSVGAAVEVTELGPGPRAGVRAVRRTATGR